MVEKDRVGNFFQTEDNLKIVSNMGMEKWKSMPHEGLPLHVTSS